MYVHTAVSLSLVCLGELIFLRGAPPPSPMYPRPTPDWRLIPGATEEGTSSSGTALTPLGLRSEPPISVEADDDDDIDDDADVDDWFGEGRPPFTPAERGSFESMIAVQDAEDKFRAWSLFICWPSDGKWPARCLEAFEGSDFFYVGEAEGGATRMPWHLLREEWELERRVAIPNWPGFKDALWWYRRKGAAPLPPSDP